MSPLCAKQLHTLTSDNDVGGRGTYPPARLNLGLFHRSMLTALTALVLSGCGGSGQAPQSEPIDEFGDAENPIVGGTVTAGHPAVIALTASDGYLVCSGTIVDATHFVTAAHCV